MATALLLLAAGTVILWGSAESLVRGAAALGRRARISPIVIGLTVVSVGTSAPELVVSIAAVTDGRPGMAMGNVLGSNLANVGLILALAALIRPLGMAPGVVRRDLPWMLGVTLLLVPLLLDNGVGRAEGALLAAVLGLYLAILARGGRTRPAELTAPTPGNGNRRAAPVSRKRAGTDRPWRGSRAGEGVRPVVLPLLLVVAGSAGLVLGGRWIVSGAGVVATELGIPETLVGLSIVAVGTSLPELATTIIAAVRKEADLAVGNILGSNIFNLTFVLGGTALVHPLELEPGILRVEYPAVLALSIALLPLAWTRGRVTRLEGLLLLGLYGAAWGWILTAGGAWG